MALDNPSYFSVVTEAETLPPPSALDLAKRAKKMGNNPSSAVDSISSSSECSLSRQLTPPRGSYQSRGSLRSFLRSMSSNSADSNQELLIMGEPRLSDIAPDLAFKFPPNLETRRSNSLKNTKKCELQSNDLMYCPLPTSEEAVVSEISGDEEVFLCDDSARYYNFSAASNVNRRRHSIGTFMARERSASIASSSKSFKEDFPQAIVHATADADPVRSFASIPIDDHSLRHGSYPRKRCNRCTKKPLVKQVNMDDILIVSAGQSQAATLWVDYFTSYFQQFCKHANRKPFRVQFLHVEDITDTTTDLSVVAQRAANVKLQLIVVCPSLLDIVSQNPASTSHLGRIIFADRTLALLLGVSDNDLNDIHRNAFSTYSQWQRLSVGQDQDENFTKEFLGTAMAIFSRVWKQQSSVVSQEKSLFSIVPKKIRQGHNSVVVILTHPLQREDTVKISIERNNEIIEVKSVKRRNPYTLKITVPEICTEVSAIVHILVEKNGSIIGSRPIKCESRLRELEQILRSNDNPFEFMCQALGFSPSDKEHLDSCLVHSFQKNIPQNFNLLANTSESFGGTLQTNKFSHEEYPTLLHFAAQYGLEKFTLQLLDCPGGDVACDLRNACDLTPPELAENAGFTDLAHTLRGYMKMNEFTNMYSKLKIMSTYANVAQIDDENAGYLTPKQISDNMYKICPPPRPINPVSPSLATERQHYGYMTMNSTAGKSPTTEISPGLTSPSTKNQMPKLVSSIKDNTDKPINRIPSPQPKNFEVCEDKVQKELLEIINDFKNNVHSISQVEKLVDEWKNRNDVQKSFKEKQEQLNQMRTRYDQIQQEMKSNKKSTPFDRIKKLFFKTKAKEEETNASNSINIPLPSASLPSSMRPISSLSLQSTSSSGSSGRMSTISGCSIGDSGTHSDHEERKNVLVAGHDDDFRSELSRAIMNFNYTIPPAPRPYQPGKSSVKGTTFATIEERPPHPTPRPNPDHDSGDTYYIHFPPSGKPVRSNEKECDKKPQPIDKEDQPVYLECDNVEPPQELTTEQEYMNLPVNTPQTHKQYQEDEDFHEYMNFTPAP